jgi:hypothetical protein
MHDTTHPQVQKPPEPRSTSLLVGLDNQGATCYLNSLIQAMYMTPEIRFGLFNVDPKELGVYSLDEYLQEKKEAATLGIIEADESLLAQMKDMGCEEAVSKLALVAVKNVGMMDAFEYIEKNEKALKAEVALSTEEAKKKKKKPRLIPLELQRLFTQMQQLDRRSLSTQELTTRGFQWQGMDGAVQHDAHELNRLLIDALEKSLKKTSGEQLCSKLYKGLTVNQIKCLTCNNISEREEQFYDLNVQVVDCSDLASSLRQYCSAEMLQGDSAYQCDKCQGKRTAQRSTVLRSLPPVLTFSCNRFKIDKSTNWQRQKVCSKSSFPLLLDMGRFVEGSEHTAETICRGAKEEGIQTALRDSMVWVDDVNACAKDLAADFVNKYGIDLEYEQLSAREKSQISRTLKDADAQAAAISSFSRSQASQIEVPTPTSDNTSPLMNEGKQKKNISNLYQLFAVIMHRGSAHSGHYFAYIRDSLEEGQWELPESYYKDDSKTTNNERKQIIERSRRRRQKLSVEEDIKDEEEEEEDEVVADSGPADDEFFDAKESHNVEILVSPTPPVPVVISLPPVVEDLMYVYMKEHNKMKIDETSIIGDIYRQLVEKMDREKPSKDIIVVPKALNDEERRLKRNEEKVAKEKRIDEENDMKKKLKDKNEYKKWKEERDAKELKRAGIMKSLEESRAAEEAKKNPVGTIVPSIDLSELALSWESDKGNGKLTDFLKKHDDIFTLDNKAKKVC